MLQSFNILTSIFWKNLMNNQTGRKFPSLWLLNYLATIPRINQVLGMDTSSNCRMTNERTQTILSYVGEERVVCVLMYFT